MPKSRAIAEKPNPVTSERHTYAIFSALYAPHMGGVESYTAGLAGELAKLGHRAVVVTSQLAPEHPAHETQENGVEVFRLPCRPLLGGRLPLPMRNAEHARLLDQVAALEPTRVVANTRFYGHSLDGVRFAKRLNVPAIVIEHGSAHLSLGNPLIDRVVEAYEHRATERIKGFGYPFFGVSSACLKWLEHFDIEGRDVVPNSVDMEAYAATASSRDFRAELGISEKTMLVTSVGRLVPEKGVGELLEAARILSHQGEFAFAFAGDGPLLEAVRETQAAGFSVFALGRLNAADVAALLKAGDAYCLPSRSEGFATTLLEACAVEAYPIVTNVGGARELGIGKNGGYLLPDMSAASIVEALQHACAHRGRCAEEGRELSRKAKESNSWHASALALEAAFELTGKEA